MLQVLVPTDFSNNSYNALYYAARLFKDRPATFHIVNVCSSGNDPQKEKAESAAIQELDALVHRLVRDAGENERHMFKKVPLCCDLTTGIAAYALKEKVDVTVIGNKEKEEIKHILFGNNAMQLVRDIKTCPVLVVPLEIDFKKVEKLAFTSNYANPISQKNIDTITFFGGLMDSEIIPMSIEEKEGGPLVKKHRSDFLEAVSADASKEVKLPVFDGKVNTILEFIELWGIDMLCMVYHPHHFFLEFIGKGIIKELNTKLKVPFLILPDNPN